MAGKDTATIKVVDQLIKSRRTVREFAPDPIDDSTLRQLIEAAVWAPNHRMTEPWRFYVLKKGGEGRRKVSDLVHAWTLENTPNANQRQASADSARDELLESPGLVYAYALTGNSDEIAEENYAAVACAGQNLMLAAHARGLGVGWSTGKPCKPADLAAALGVNEPSRVAGCLYIGYPAKEPSSKRRVGSDVTSWL